jgi:hypothetical protein
VWVRTFVVSVVPAFAVKTILLGRTVPDGVVGVALSA